MKAFAGTARRRSWKAAAVGLVVVSCVAGAGIYLVTAGSDSTAAGGDATAVRCRPDLRRGVLPVWARLGFSDRAPRFPHVVGRSEEIVAVVFGDPLHWPPSKGGNNKILWVARQTGAAPSDLTIDAQRMRGARNVGSPVRRVVERGPGPSIVDLPGAGCWRLTLSWSGRQDTVDLRYVRRAATS